MIPIAFFLRSSILRRAIKEESKVAEREGVDYQVCSLLQYINVTDNLFKIRNYFKKTALKKVSEATIYFN